MSTFVLVHGAMHGAWCWYRVVPLLERAGHRVVAVDLPGHGIHRAVQEPVTMTSYVERLDTITESLGEPVVLVGHSLGGGVVAQFAALQPQRVRHLALVAALVASDGENSLDCLNEGAAAGLHDDLRFSEDQTCVSVREEAWRSRFYTDCGPEDLALARLLLVPQPVAPLAAPLRLESTGFASVPKSYVRCLQDRTLRPEFQSRIAEGLSCRRVRHLDTSHSPFFSAPGELATLLFDSLEAG